MKVRDGGLKWRSMMKVDGVILLVECSRASTIKREIKGWAVKGNQKKVEHK